MNESRKSDAKRLWVAVKVERGFVKEAKIFESIDAARRTERKWRANLNPDYDEAAVVEGQFVPHTAGLLRRDC